MTAQLEKLKKLYVKATDVYNNGGKPLMTDAQFDALEDNIRAVDPTWAELAKTGAPVKNKKQEIALAKFMPSLHKAYPEAIAKWLKRVPCPSYLALDKLDGSALLLTREGGRAVQLVTRGNGTLGKDISFLIPHLNIPRGERTEPKMHFRCEAVISRNVFNTKWATSFDDPRSMVNGLLNRQARHPAMSDIDIVVLGVYGERLRTGLRDAARSCLLTVRMTQELSLDAEKLTALLAARRKSSIYDIDGLVIAPFDFQMDYETAAKPKNIIAFKVNNFEDSVQATVESVTWQISGRGRIIPKICIAPTKIGGVMVKHATAHNAVWLVDRRIGPGAVVQLCRSGGVIPKIEAVIKKGKLQLPEIDYVTKGVHFVVDGATRVVTAGIDAKNIVKFTSTMGVDNVAAATAAALVKVRVNTPLHLLGAWYSGELHSLLYEAGIGEKMSTNIVKSMDSVFVGAVSMKKLLVASQVFDAGIGERKLSMIEDAGIAMNSLIAGKVTVKKLVAVPGFSDITARLVLTGLPKAIAFVKAARCYISVIGTLPSKGETPLGKLTGEKVSFTSYRDKAHEAAVIAAGGEVVGYGAKTTILLYKEGGKSSSKIDDALDRNIRVCPFDALGLK